MASPNSFGQLGLSILGLGTQYPPYALKPDAVDTLARRYHDADSAAMKKVLSINRFTGIDVSGPCPRAEPHRILIYCASLGRQLEIPTIQW